jgi:5-oxoprolinase (ATP-hydrolysing) subunit A
MTRIDLNCDMGEFPEAIADGTQESLLHSLTSINIACGGHAGDAQTMRATIEQALRHGVAIGAHPGYPDRANFGRIELHLAPRAIADSVFEQLVWLADVAEAHAARITHVKPHGALYNQAAKDRTIAQAVADGVARWDREPVLIGLAGSLMLDVFRDAGFLVAAEAFADRRYEPDGSLRPRKFADSLLHDPVEAAEQALRIAQKETVIASNGAEIPIRAQTICIHSDTPGAQQIAAAVAQALHAAGIQLESFCSG